MATIYDAEVKIVSDWVAWSGGQVKENLERELQEIVKKKYPGVRITKVKVRRQ